MSQEDHDTVLAWAVDHARQAYGAGERPSGIIRILKPVFLRRLHYYNSVLFVRVFAQAFDLSLTECKRAAEWWHPEREELVDDGIDDYLIPLIERNREARASAARVDARMDATATEIEEIPCYAARLQAVHKIKMRRGSPLGRAGWMSCAGTGKWSFNAKTRRRKAAKRRG